VPKTAEHHAEQAEMRRRWPLSVDDIVASRQAPRNALLCRLVLALHGISDAVVLAHPYMVEALQGCDGRRVIYESNNVETNLKRGLLQGHPDFERLVRDVETCERKAIRLAAEVVVVADGDRHGLQMLGAAPSRGHCVPHGVDVPPTSPDHASLGAVRALFRGHLFAIFVGSAHPPNIEAALHICTRLATALPDWLFGIVGSVCEALPPDMPSNVLRLGRLDDASKDVVVEAADVALNPMTSGSGSNLKLGEYFAKGLPTVTTGIRSAELRRRARRQRHRMRAGGVSPSAPGTPAGRNPAPRYRCRGLRAGPRPPRLEAPGGAYARHT
jgi:hypothetical protein